MTRREFGVAAAVAAVLAVMLTWPLAARLGTAGRVDSGDGRYSVWNVGWVAHALTTNPLELYDANIFFPAGNTLAFSEANLVAGALAVPVWLLTKNAVAATNWVVLCAFALSALSMFALVRHLTGSRAAAAFSGLAFGFCPYLFSHIPHIQLLMAFGLPFTLLALHRFDERPSAWRAAALGGAMALQGLSSAYYGVFAGLAAAFGFVWFGVAHGRIREWRYWGMGVLAAGCAALIVAPFFLPYLAVRDAGFGRTLDDARLFSVGWRGYFASAVWVHRWMLPLLGHWREVLFPGFLTIGLALVAVARVVRGGVPPSTRAPRAVAAFYVTLMILAIWASQGPDLGLYRVLYETIPLFSFLRAPARFGFMVTLCASVLAGMALTWVCTRQPLRRRRVIVAGALVLGLAESWVGPLQLTPVPPMRAAYTKLAQLPWGPVAEFPMFNQALDRSRQTEYMLRSTEHWKPLINGYSDYFPGDWIADMLKLAAFPSRDAWRVLADRKVRYVIIHWNRYEPEDRDALARQMDGLAPYLRPMVTDSEVSLYDFAHWSLDSVQSRRFP